MTVPVRLPTRADLEALPPGVKGEIIEGTLYTTTRPRAHHQRAVADAYADLGAPFTRGRGGPGGWWILVEPGIELPSAVEFSPDLAGWRRGRLPELPTDEPIRVVPDWICEVLSPTTRRYDLVTKKAYYAKIGVSFLWYLDLDHRMLTAHRLQTTAGGVAQWLEIGSYGEDTAARIERFEAVPLDLTAWYAPVVA